jgi:hypothetical protein
MTLNQQIEEVDRELAYRAHVYPRLVSSGKLRQSIATYQVDRLKAVRATLVWLQKNEQVLKHRMES